jgi:4'-phosphopantetheinyl transferase
MGGIEIWRIDLQKAGDVAQLYALLSAEEQARADLFRFAEHRQRFIVAHAALRQILAAQLDLPPAQIRFSHTAAGKPAIDPASALTFNLSHSHQRAVVALASKRQLGVDLEYRARRISVKRMLSCFSPDEREQLAKLDTTALQQAVLTTWVRKEAYVKALGTGILAALEGFSVEIGCDHPVPLRQPLAGDTIAWHQRPISVATDYVGALVADGKAEPLTYHDWQGEALP